MSIRWIVLDAWRLVSVAVASAVLAVWKLGLSRETCDSVGLAYLFDHHPSRVSRWRQRMAERYYIPRVLLCTRMIDLRAGRFGRRGA